MFVSRLGRAADDERPVIATLTVAAGSAAFAFLFLVAQPLAALTEVRRFLTMDWTLDPVQLFFLPKPTVDGVGRIVSMALFQGTGDFCGVDASCLNAVQTALLAVAVALLVLHTYQVTRGIVLTAAVAALWAISAPVLNAALWQATQFDKLFVIMSFAISMAWWDIFGRASISRTAAVVTSLVSAVALILAFNAKETAFYLVGVLLVLAVLRGLGIPGAWRRNLLIAAPTLVYALAFIALYMTSVDQSYTAHVGGGSALDNVWWQAMVSLSVGPEFMNLGNWGPTFEQLQATAVALYVVGAVALVTLVGWASVRQRRSWKALSLRSLVPELYLGAVIVGVWSLTLFSEARGSAYYMMMPYWAAISLVFVIVRRFACSTRWPAEAAGLVLVPLVMAAALGSLSHFTGVGAVVRLRLGSERLSATGAEVRDLLAAREVTTVSWRAMGPADAEWYLLRGSHGDAVPTGDLWPFFVRDSAQWPSVHGLLEGTEATLAGTTRLYDGPGEVLIVTGPQYELRFLGHEGDVLYPAVAAAPGCRVAHRGMDEMDSHACTPHGRTS